MPKFPVDAPKEKVMKAFERLGFRLVRERNHIAMSRQNADGYSYSADYAKPSHDKSFNPAA